MLVRSQLAQFESSENFISSLNKLALELQSFQQNKKSDMIAGLIEKINFHILPKKIKKRSPSGLITNDFTQTDYELEKIMMVIDCPIELHILNVLWVMKIGKIMDQKIDQKLSYAHRLHKGELDEHSDKHRKLFVPYFENYKLWRDNGINIAKHLHSNSIDSVILTLDIKNYYYSVDFDLSKLSALESDVLFSDFGFLNEILYQMHEKYRKTLGVENKLLPIGLLSSGIIANYILNPADNEICQQVMPTYYGRYVDDFIIVLSNTSVKVDDDLYSFLGNCFNGHKIFKNDKSKGELKIDSNYGNFVIQYEKVRIINVAASQPASVIDEFEKNIRKTSSEARALVEEADMLSTFDSESSKISYSDSVHKLRSIEAFNIDKFGASSYLTNLIEATKITRDIAPEDIKKFHTSVLSYFRGSQGILAYSLWEKVITFYTIQELHNELFLFVKNLVTEINKLKMDLTVPLPFDSKSFNRNDAHSNVKTALNTWLTECVCMALALNPEREQTFIEMLKRYSESDADFDHGILMKYTAALMNSDALTVKISGYRNSNLIRHKYVTLPLINYCKQALKTSFTGTKFNSNGINFELDNSKIEYSPRYVNFHEIQIFYYFKFLFSAPGTPKKDDELLLNQIVTEYIRINSLKSKMMEIKEQFPHFYEEAIAGKNDEIANWKPQANIKCDKKNFSHKIRMAIANLSVDERDITDAILGSPNLHYNRLSKLNGVLNLAAKEKVQLIIFPEASLPIQWIDYLSKFALKHQIGIIAGVEHLNINETEVANFVCHILPFTAAEHSNVCITFRNKQDFSPEEMEWLRYNKKTPYKDLSSLYIYNWAGLHFTTFNCFEVTDMRKRAKVVGQIDLLTLVENNRDVEYFSNIVESSARDIHCIVSQVNNSRYGDSRVCLPAKKDLKDQLRIRGGMNTTILVEELDIYALRLYQMMGEYSAKIHEPCEMYKPLPPNYNMAQARRLKMTKSRKK